MKISKDLDHFNFQSPAFIQHPMSLEFKIFFWQGYLFNGVGQGEGVCLDYKNQTLVPEYKLTVERSDQNHSRWMEKSADAVGSSLHFVV